MLEAVGSNTRDALFRWVLMVWSARRSSRSGTLSRRSSVKAEDVLLRGLVYAETPEGKRLLGFLAE